MVAFDLNEPEPMMLTSMMPRQVRQVFAVTSFSKSAVTMQAIAGIFSASNIACKRLSTIDV